MSFASSCMAGKLRDRYARDIAYLRISVTDRCDLRCHYCMGEEPRFLPRAEVLTLEELARIGAAFIAAGVRKIRLTGGEPLIRRDILWLIRNLGQHLDPDAADASGRLRELAITTNGTQLPRLATAIRAAGVRRVNISLDTRDPEKFRAITRGGRLEATLEGIEAAVAAGLQVKINTVALKGGNEDEFDALIAWCGERGFDLTFIEVMPMGEVGGVARLDQYLPLETVREDLARRWHLTASDESTGGPSRYWRVRETGGRIGFIAPLTRSFCDRCNRVRLSSTGQLFLCLGQEDAVDLRHLLRSGADDATLAATLVAAIGDKPEGHAFILDQTRAVPAVGRGMHRTGG